jgi:hypothetical protein
MNMVDFVRLVSTGTTLLERGSDELLRWVVLQLSDGRQLLLAERTYRDGTKVLVEPTEEEIQAARGDPWAAWNSGRGERSSGAVARSRAPAIFATGAEGFRLEGARVLGFVVTQ